MKMNISLPSVAIDHLTQNSQLALCKRTWEKSHIYPGQFPISTSRTVSIRAIVLEYHRFLQEHPLTKRELEILQLIVQGNSNSEIAEKLNLTIGTVKTHLRNIFNKLNVNDRTQAAVVALRAGLVD